MVNGMMWFVASCPSFWHCHPTRDSLCIHGFVCVCEVCQEEVNGRTQIGHTHILGHSDTSSNTHVLYTTTNTHNKQQENRERIEIRKEKKLTPLSSSERKSGPSSSPSCCGETQKYQNGRSEYKDDRCLLLLDASENCRCK